MKATKTTVPLERLLEQLPDSYTLAERELIQRAFRLAEEAHRGQKRLSGEPYINHCLAVAIILADLQVPPEVIAAGLLHDTVEDTDITLNQLKRDFGETIATLVDGVTKLTNLPRVSRDDQHAESLNGNNGSEPADSSPHDPALGRKQDLVSETLRNTFLAMGDDVRVVIIKLADRLHNMRTLGYMPEPKRKRIARRRSIFLLRWQTGWGCGRSSGNLKIWDFVMLTRKSTRKSPNKSRNAGLTAKPRSKQSKSVFRNCWKATISGQKSVEDPNTSIPSIKR
jgi:(p)ppGpp synthase/HD superfamily hydrolase